MSTLKARVVNGRLTLDEPSDLPEGTVIELVVAEDGDELDEDERKALHAALDQAWRGLERGEPGIPAHEVVARLRTRK